MEILGKVISAKLKAAGVDMLKAGLSLNLVVFRNKQGARVDHSRFRHGGNEMAYRIRGPKGQEFGCRPNLREATFAAAKIARRRLRGRG
jgi:hypothetical protein